MQWYAARVVTGKEYDIKKKLREHIKDCELYIPRKLVTEMKQGKIQQKTERLLPGYLLIGTNQKINVDLWDNFIKIIGKVTEVELENIKRQEYTEEDVGKDKHIGDKIIVNDGPFMGCKGTIVYSNDNNTFKCKLVFQGMEINADMGTKLVSNI